MSVIRQRTKHLIGAGLIGACIAGLLLSSLLIYQGMMQAEEKEKLAAENERQLRSAAKVEEERKQLMRKVLAAGKDVTAGEQIGQEAISVIEMPADAVSDDMIVDAAYPLKKFAKIDIRRNAPLTKSMLFEEGVVPDDLRNEEFAVLRLPSDLKIGQFVDVRIKFPTGQDYIVLAKKKVEQLAGGVVWHQVDEQEILAMSSAIVDAYLHHATLYSLTYVDPYVQNKAIPNYPINADVMALIKSDPNVVDAAKRGLEVRVREQLERDLQRLSESQSLVPQAPYPGASLGSASIAPVTDNGSGAGGAGTNPASAGTGSSPSGTEVPGQSDVSPSSGSPDFGARTGTEGSAVPGAMNGSGSATMEEDDIFGQSKGVTP